MPLFVLERYSAISREAADQARYIVYTLDDADRLTFTPSTLRLRSMWRPWSWRLGLAAGAWGAINRAATDQGWGRDKSRGHGPGVGAR